MKLRKNISKKGKIILTVLVILIISFSYLLFYETKYDGPIQFSDKILVISHRGFGVHGPDNSLVAAEMALENDLDGIDVDGQISSDGELVIFHDLSVDRLTEGTGKVSEKTLEELLSLDLGIKYGESFEGSYVKTFEDFLVTVNGTAVYMVELKVSSTKETGIEKRAAEIIDKYNAYEYVYISSFNPVVLYRLEKKDPRINTVLIFMDTNWNPELLAEIKPEDVVNYPWFLRQEPIRRVIRKIIKPDLLSVNHQVSKKTIDKLLDNGYPIFLWTVNTELDIIESLQKNPYGIITDQPLLGKELRDGI